MPDELAQVYGAISHELTWLYAKWNVFFQLYAVSEEPIAFLDGVASSFFGMLQRVYVDDIFLSISRLTDSPRTAGRENLVLLQLIEVLDPTEDPVFYGRVRDLITSIQQHCAPFRVQRNRRIAHLDLPTALNLHPVPLPEINRKMIEDALKMTANMLNLILGHYENTETAYSSVVLRGDGKDVVFLLQQAMEYDKHKREHL